MTMTAADLAQYMTNAQGPAQDTAKQNDANLKMATGIVDFLKDKLTVTLNTGTVVTTGSSTTQTGPAAPVVLGIS